MEAKRIIKTSSAVKDRYNKKVYDSVSVRLPKELVEAFKKKCLEKDISQAQIIKQTVEEFIAK